MRDDQERLEGLACEGTFDDVPFVAWHLPAGASPHGESATRALTGILGRATAAELVRFERYGRSAFGFWTAWARLRPDEVSRLHPAVQRLATFHPGGYVRESAVVALAARDDDDDLPYLLLRMNDWVAPVAIRAGTAVASRIDAKRAPAFVRWLSIIAHLRGARRRDVFGPVRAIDALLASASARDALIDGLRTGPREIRRECARIAAAAPDPAAVELLAVAARDRDSIVALRAVDALGARLEGPALRAALVPLVDCACADVRLRAMRALCAAESSDLEPALQRALFDRSAPVRELARYELGRRGYRGFAAGYANALKAGDGPRLSVALRGIGECGAAQDAVEVSPFVSHALARVRAAAIKSLARLAPDASVSRFSAALEDGSGRVVRAALEALRGRAHLLDRGHLHALLDGASAPRTACAALALLCEGDLWEALALVLRALRSREPAVRGAAAAHLERLLALDTYVRPANLEALEAAARGIEDLLPPHLHRRVVGALASARLMR